MSFYLVTGGAGFIGSNIVEALLAKDERVRIIDNFSTGSEQNITEFASHIEIVEGDIADENTVEKAVRGVDYILHQAALPSVPRSIKDPIATNNINIGGTLNILNAAKKSEVKRVVYASSSSVYGNTDMLPKHEDLTPNPMSPYAITKLTGEYYCKLFSQIYGLETISLRYFNVFGPKQDANSQYAAVIAKFVSSMLQGKGPVIYGDGEQTRDFTYVNNVVEANILASCVPSTKGEVLNVACGQRFSLNQLIEVLNSLIGKDIKPRFSDLREGDVKHSLADIGKAREVLGYKPNISLKKGLSRLISWVDEEEAQKIISR